MRLSIKGHIDGIQISYFKQSCENLGLDFKEVQMNLKEIQDIYIEKYPKYVEKIKTIPHTNDFTYFDKKLLESHKKCLKIAKSEMNNELQGISAQKPKISLSKKSKSNENGGLSI